MWASENCDIMSRYVIKVSRSSKYIYLKREYILHSKVSSWACMAGRLSTTINRSLRLCFYTFEIFSLSLFQQFNKKKKRKKNEYGETVWQVLKNKRNIFAAIETNLFEAEAKKKRKRKKTEGKKKRKEKGQNNNTKFRAKWSLGRDEPKNNINLIIEMKVLTITNFFWPCNNRYKGFNQEHVSYRRCHLQTRGD